MTTRTDVQAVCDAFLPTPSRQLSFSRLPFTGRDDAHFVVDFVGEHRNAINYVSFLRCTFEDADLNVLTEGFATMPDVQVKVALSRNQFPNGVRSHPNFPSLTELATHFTLVGCGFGDDCFECVVDTILRGSGKQRLNLLHVSYNRLSSNSLRHVTRLFQQSKLEHLVMLGNDGLLTDEAKMQSFCNDGIKNAESIKRIDFGECAASDIKAIAAANMIANALTVGNTSLMEVNLFQVYFSSNNEIIKPRLYPLLERNRQIFWLQSLLDCAATYDKNPITTPDVIWHHMVQYTAFLDSPDLSALYLALRNVTVGQCYGEQVQLLLQTVAPIMIEQERRHSSTQIQRWWRQQSMMETCE